MKVGAVAVAPIRGQQARVRAGSRAPAPASSSWFFGENASIDGGTIAVIVRGSQAGT